MNITNGEIINAFTDIDEMMQNGNGPIMLLSPIQMFELGQFYEWAKLIVNNDDINLDNKTFVPEPIEWVVGETQGW